MKYSVFLMALILQGCGLIQDRSSEYARAPVSKPITIPAELSDNKVQSQYPVPEISNRRPINSKFELPKPPNATSIVDEAPYVVEVLDDQIWLRVYSAPGKVWPLLDAFWREYEIETAHEDISSGFVVTKTFDASKKLQQALSNKSSAEVVLENSYIQTQLTQGLRRNTSEIKLQVLPASGTEQPLKSWQSGTHDINKDKALLELIGAFITSDALQNRYSLLANSIGGTSKVQLLKNEAGDNYLLIHLSFQRAWNELEKALKSAEIVVADKNFSSKHFYISYLNASEISGWYYSESRINEMKRERNFTLILENLPDGSIRVNIEQNNEKLDPSLKNEILDMVFEHIS